MGVRVFHDTWERFTLFLAFHPRCGAPFPPQAGVPITNAIESLNYQLRKIIKNCGLFPSDEAVVKLLWLAICNIEDKRARERTTSKDSSRKAAGRLIEGQQPPTRNKP